MVAAKFRSRMYYNCCVLYFKAKTLNFDKFTTSNVPCKLVGKTMGLTLGTIFSEEWWFRLPHILYYSTRASGKSYHTSFSADWILFSVRYASLPLFLHLNIEGSSCYEINEKKLKPDRYFFAYFTRWSRAFYIN